VLVVDDDADLRNAVADVLREEGCSVYVAGDGEEALQILRVVVPDLIVTDLMMPRMDGWMLCAALRKSAVLRDTPVAILSAFVDEQPLEGVRVIRKPVDLNALVALLDVVRETCPPPSA
jgi:CheY-like chemotaxis protein